MIAHYLPNSIYSTPVFYCFNLLLLLKPYCISHGLTTNFPWNFRFLFPNHVKSLQAFHFHTTLSWAISNPHSLTVKKLLKSLRFSLHQNNNTHILWEHVTPSKRLHFRRILIEQIQQRLRQGTMYAQWILFISVSHVNFHCIRFGIISPA
jgi:hypothetical protein